MPHTKCSKGLKGTHLTFSLLASKVTARIKLASGVGLRRRFLSSSYTRTCIPKYVLRRAHQATVMTPPSSFFLFFLSVFFPCMKRKNCCVQSSWDRGGTAPPSAKLILLRITFISRGKAEDLVLFLSTTSLQVDFKGAAPSTYKNILSSVFPKVLKL